MVREFTELQGIMGGIYAREEGLPEEVWKAIYFHYLPVSTEADAAPSRLQLGKAAPTWAAVALADKLDTLVNLFAAGERPTGSRDPYGLRRAAHGVLKILVDLQEITGLSARPSVQSLVAAAGGGALSADAHKDLLAFMQERLVHILVQRGYDRRNVNAVTAQGLGHTRPLDDRRKLEVLPEFTRTADFQLLAKAFKRVKNIAKEMPPEEFQKFPDARNLSVLSEPAEQELLAAIDKRGPAIREAVEGGVRYREAFAEASRFGPLVDRFFADVLVMSPDQELKWHRLWLMRRLEALMLQLGDISEIVAEGGEQP